MTYHLACPVCGGIFADTYLLNCPNGCRSLLKTEYGAEQLTIRDLPGVFRFSEWLPVHGSLPTRSGPVGYRSSGLAEALGLTSLFIVFSGYAPERGAAVISGSFKEFEALPTFVRLHETAGGVIQVSSAGNTGRAFAEISAQTGYPAIIVIPKKASDRIWTSEPAENLLLVTVPGDYTDAIQIGDRISALPGVYPEGGAKNVARRDGMGTVMLEATLGIGRMPEWYVQAVGSGTGGIAAWEAALRLKKDGRFGAILPRLLLIQNEPFTPMASAWRAGRREILPEDMPDARESIDKVFSDVLTNRSPPYGLPGGVYDALSDTNGCIMTVSSEMAEEAFQLVSSAEGYDPDRAAAVAVAGLKKAVHEGIIQRDASVLLNITGGGYRTIERDLTRYLKKPDIIMDDISDTDMVLRRVSEWVQRYV